MDSCFWHNIYAVKISMQVFSLFLAWKTVYDIRGLVIFLFFNVMLVTGGSRFVYVPRLDKRPGKAIKPTFPHARDSSWWSRGVCYHLGEGGNILEIGMGAASSLSSVLSWWRRGLDTVTTTISIKSLTLEGTHSNYVSSGLFRRLTSGHNLVFLRLLLS